jgi:hypothetical protein
VEEVEVEGAVSEAGLVAPEEVVAVAAVEAVELGLVTIVPVTCAAKPVISRESARTEER